MDPCVDTAHIHECITQAMILLSKSQIVRVYVRTSVPSVHYQTVQQVMLQVNTGYDS